MALRNLHSVVAVTALTGAALGATALPARAGSYSNGQIQLTMSKEGPIWGDNNDLIYNMHLTNAGPNTATGTVVHVTGWFCEGGRWSLESCSMLPDRDDPSRPMSYDIRVNPLAPGQPDSFPVTAVLPTEEAGTVRTTAEVVQSDQYDTASVPDKCVQGWNPQPDCVSDVQPLT